MIGNDIVDLEIANIQSDWQRKGFLHKIFTNQEQIMIERAKNPFQLVWLFWSMKESAYKCHAKKMQKRFFAPIKLQCELISESEGLVLINDERYFTNSRITRDYIFTEASNVRNTMVEQDFFNLNGKVYATSSFAVRHKLKKAISKSLKVSIDALSIKKNVLGIPKLYQNEKQLQVSFSMSHHGNYGAYSILKTEA